MPNADLSSSYRSGSLELPNRIVMAPMTRLRATADGVPTDLNATYYAQRASAGLIVTECTMVEPMSQAYMHSPGLFSEAQRDGWKKVVDAVHQKNGRIFVQLWHAGRTAHSELLPGNALPVAPSAIAAEGDTHTPSGKKPFETPRALDVAEIGKVVESFARAAELAAEAGFDGVEIHGAFGYLIEQFLADGSNKRTDGYGGWIENRSRFLFEVIDAVAETFDLERIGVKLSPANTYHGTTDSDRKKTWGYVIERLGSGKIGYVHLMEPTPADIARGVGFAGSLDQFGRFVRGTLITNGGYDYDRGTRVVAAGAAQLVSFGQLFIANPDLPERFKKKASLNEPDPKTFYGRNGQGAAGYTDYSPLS